MALSFRHGFLLGVLPLCGAAFVAGRSTAAPKLVVVEREAAPAPTTEPLRELPRESVTAPAEPAPVASAAPRIIRLEHAPRCEDVALRGVVMAQDPSASRALLTFGGETSWRIRSERFGEYRLFHVGPDRAWLARDKSEDAYAICQLELGREARTSPPTASPSAPRTAAAPNVGSARLPLAHLASKIERRSEDDFVIDRSVIDEMADQQGALGSLVRATPENVDGRTVGLVLQTVKAGSVLEKLGLKSGDRLRRAAGVDLTGVDAGLTAFARLRTMPKFSIEIVRDGAPKSVQYEVR